ncbi:HemY protein [Natronocella acetinitrilica]|uniref:HemY protein n=1 Tax=Natronocella acetinitrilica TaxID=414046 RepID=A0AAE3G192_9GAMM|nr:heme biosynthesis HemY N-terminal domain-containing protein [Natronocella acetinitrilica]MCP1673328.1 HemY protein [Natronocella acetinitrilica]
MKKLLILLAALLLSVLAALWFQENGGYVLVHVGGTSVQASLFMAIGALILFMLATWLVLRMVFGVARAPRGVRGWLRSRRIERSRGRMLRGLQKLAEGDFNSAERDMLKTVQHSETPLLHYLSAAWASHRMGAENRRDHYLALADQASPDARLAVGLVQAQLYVEDEQWETAFATLNLLHDRWPRQARVLELLALVCRKLEEWERLLDLLPQLRRHAPMDPGRAEELEALAAAGYLKQASRQGLDPLARAWARLPRASTQMDPVRLAYIDGRLLHDDGDAEAEKLLRTVLRKHWEPQYVRRFGNLRMANPQTALAAAEGWLRERPDDAELLLAAARLSLVAGHWSRARNYLEKAVTRASQPEACYLLARMLEQTGENDKAAHQYRLALEQDARFQSPMGLDELAKHHMQDLETPRLAQQA